MATKKKDDNPSVPEEHLLPTDKHFSDDGRKLKDLDYVGESSPDADPDLTGADPVRPKSRPAGSPPNPAEEDPTASRR
jgi:hypothetical protein